MSPPNGHTCTLAHTTGTLSKSARNSNTNTYTLVALYQHPKTIKRRIVLCGKVSSQFNNKYSNSYLASIVINLGNVSPYIPFAFILYYILYVCMCVCMIKLNELYCAVLCCAASAASAHIVLFHCYTYQY